MSDQPPVTIGAGEIQFVEACYPPLTAGCYRMKVAQVVGKTKTDVWERSEQTAQLVLEGPRFSLSPSDIQSVYPPANQKGQFSGVLPHVVLTRRTIPWECRLAPAAESKGAGAQGDRLPWVALLLVQEDELVYTDEQGQPTKRMREIRALPITRSTDGGDSLLQPSGGESVLAPRLVPPAGPSSRDGGAPRKSGCLAIDLPATLFKRIAPSERDLKLLAHARQVNTSNKEVALVNDKGWFSVVIGNRLPSGGKRHRAMLVSLEGHRELLAPDWVPGPDQEIRLVVLGSWTFECDENRGDFAAHMGKLERKERPDDLGCSPFRLHLPKEMEQHASEAVKTVGGAYAFGYTALDHVIRQGTRTASWYRGPLVPLRYETLPPRAVSCADALLRYDPRNGLFDVSYAAAWQLGRLLALQNPGFTLSLDRARRDLRAGEERRLHQVRLSQRDREAPRSALETLIAVAQQGDASAASSAPEPESAALTEVSTYLARLALLYGVPLSYLVPDRAMLPESSIRFFRLDPAWIQVLLQGACSIGGTAYGDKLVHDAMFPASEGAPRLQAKIATVRDDLRQQHEGAKAETHSTGLFWPPAGFLLRSPVVDNWRGLEVKAFGENDRELCPLRIEQLSKDVLLALFNGEIGRVVVQQPRESLHFGVSRGSDEASTTKSLRSLIRGQASQAIDKIEFGKTACMRQEGKNDVIRIAELAAAIQQKLAAQLPSSSITSAEFAVEMVEGAHAFCFQPMVPANEAKSR